MPLKDVGIRRSLQYKSRNLHFCRDFVKLCLLVCIYLNTFTYIYTYTNIYIEQYTYIRVFMYIYFCNCLISIGVYYLMYRASSKRRTISCRFCLI